MTAFAPSPFTIMKTGVVLVADQVENHTGKCKREAYLLSLQDCLSSAMLPIDGEKLVPPCGTPLEGL